MSNYMMDYAKGDQGGENRHGPNVDPSDMPVPSDLIPYYRHLKSGHWCYVCPHCGLVFKPFWAGMPEAFRIHALRWDLDSFGREAPMGLGCCCKPVKGKKDPGKTSSLSKVGDFK